MTGSKVIEKIRKRINKNVVGRKKREEDGGSNGMENERRREEEGKEEVVQDIEETRI